MRGHPIKNFKRDSGASQRAGARLLWVLASDERGVVGMARTARLWPTSKTMGASAARPPATSTASERRRGPSLRGQNRRSREGHISSHREALQQLLVTNPSETLKLHSPERFRQQVRQLLVRLDVVDEDLAIFKAFSDEMVTRLNVLAPAMVLQDEYGGLVSPRFIEDYTSYADLCFKNFGDRVKHWVTVNEPNIEPIGGYDKGSEPPRRCSYPFGTNCTGGNSSTEPYITAHHLLLAHASAVSLYREKYKASQAGQIGITLLGWWHEPATNTSQDAAAATRMNDFHLGWFMHPLVYGDYPPEMRSRVGARLPALTMEQSKKVRGSFDFIGFNHYLVVRVQADESIFKQKQRDYYADAAAIADPFEDIQEGHLEYAPWALGKLLEHLKVKYGNPPVMIHENGDGETPKTPSKIEYDDDHRSEILQDYLEVLYLSIRNGSNARGYFVWSFLDVFEFLFGYRVRFGLYGVDMNAEGRTRYARNSARWYSGFLNGGDLRPTSPPGEAYDVA